MSRPESRKYSVTTFEPGARLVFTHGWRVSPRSTAFFASSPAPIITLGFDVFVQLVIAAITTEPCSSAVPMDGTSATAAAAPPVAAEPCADPAATATFLDVLAIIDVSPAWKPLFACFSDTRSCGRLGNGRQDNTHTG